MDVRALEHVASAVSAWKQGKLAPEEFAQLLVTLFPECKVICHPATGHFFLFQEGSGELVWVIPAPGDP